MENVKMLFQFVGGLGMFLYGMNTMADGLQKAAGNRMKSLLKVITSNRFFGVLVGTLITAIIQSSSATTVMVVGFVNAGLFNLSQAVGVIMGANIGTTVTSWIVSMNEWGEVLKPEFFSPVLIGIGAFVILFAKDNKKKQIGEILVGFGVLFIGLTFMSSSIEPYREAPVFTKAFALFGSNPLLGILAGAAVTAVIQSSSASVGILQTLAMNGMVNWGAAVFITLGQNIGTCVTALLASMGTHRTAKRAAVIHLLFNVLGAVIFGTLSFIVFKVVPKWSGMEINSVQISIFHTIFNLTNTLLLFPFANGLVKLSGFIVRKTSEGETEENELEELATRLDKRILENPGFAVETAVREVVDMGWLVMKNLKKAKTAFFERNVDIIKQIQKNEVIINGYEKQLAEYLVKINNLSLNDAQHRLIKNLFYTINDIERVGDHCDNISELAQNCIDEGEKFSEEAMGELAQIFEQTILSYEAAINARLTGDMEFIRKELKYEEEVDRLEPLFRSNHVERLARGECNTRIGVLFTDALSNLERISDHAENITQYIIEEKKE